MAATAVPTGSAATTGGAMFCLDSENWWTNSRATYAEELLTARGGGWENGMSMGGVVGEGGGVSHFEQPQMVQKAAASHSGGRSALPNNSRNNDYNSGHVEWNHGGGGDSVGRTFIGESLSEGAMSTMAAGGGGGCTGNGSSQLSAYHLQHLEQHLLFRSQKLHQQQKSSHDNNAVPVGPWPAVPVGLWRSNDRQFPEDLELFLLEDGEEGSDFPNMLVQNTQPLTTDFPRRFQPRSLWHAQQPHIQSQHQHQQRFQSRPRGLSDGSVVCPSLSGAVSPPSPGPYLTCPQLRQQEAQQLQNVFDWLASPHIGGMSVSCRALSPTNLRTYNGTKQSSPAFCAKSDFLRNTGGKPGWESEGRGFDNGSSDGDGSGGSVEDSLRSLVEEVSVEGGLLCFDFAKGAAAATAVSAPAATIVAPAGGSDCFDFMAAAVTSAVPATAATAVVPRGIAENVSRRRRPVSSSSSSDVPPEWAATSCSAQEEKQRMSAVRKMKIAKKAASSPEGGSRPRKAPRTTSSVPSNPHNGVGGIGGGGRRTAAGRGLEVVGGVSIKRETLTREIDVDSPADGNMSGEPLLDDKTKRSREKNRDHSRRSRERKKAQIEALKKAVADLSPYRTLVEQAHDMVSVHSANSSAIFALANGGFLRLLGMDPTKLLGSSLLDLVDPKDAREVLNAINAAIAHGGNRQVQYLMRPPGGGLATEVETSFRVASKRLNAITRGVDGGGCTLIAPLGTSLRVPAAEGSTSLIRPLPVLAELAPPSLGGPGVGFESLDVGVLTEVP